MVKTLNVHALLVTLVVSASGAAAAENREPSRRFWGDFGLGYGRLNGGSAPGGDDSGGVWLDLVVGGRLSERWLLGLNVGAVGSRPSSSNYKPYVSYSNIYGQAVTNLFLVTQFEPLGDHGWFFGAGGGRVLYHNHALETVTGNARSGEGTGGIALVGYDWKTGTRVHFEAQLSVETGNISLAYPVAGTFSFSAVALSLHVARH
jgi:hypothetical protein